ncbi:MAG: hypothetical protein WBC20_13525 [Candidatus Aminicenantaceae bacterium]
MIQSKSKGAVVLLPVRLLIVLPLFFFLFLSVCFSVDNSDLKEILVKYKEYSFLQEEEQSVFKEGEIFRVAVIGSMDWTDTRLEVKENQEIYFMATGGISLQKANPKAFCGPDGYPLMTMQQPFSDRNIGALIGKVVKIISIELDEETGEEIRHEIGEKFFIGTENRISIPLSGRLYLGINENVIGDNSGEYEVIIYLAFLLFPHC